MSKKSTTIGFFGDSFCADVFNDHSIKYNYTTYLEKVAKHYNAKITNVGVGGSSVWDLILLQFKEQCEKGLPNICVFVWTDMQRLFNRSHRNINIRSIERINSNEHMAAKNFFYYLYDDEQQRVGYTALLYYFDTVILPKFPTSKFIHLWSFGEELNNTRHYLYDWTTGIEIRPALELFSFQQFQELPESDSRANHIAGDEENQQIANLIIDAIDCLQAI
jgi:hypothetical protein